MFIDKAYLCLSSAPPLGDFLFFNLLSFEARNCVVKSVIQMMVVIIITIAVRIMGSMCAVLCMIAFYS